MVYTRSDSCDNYPTSVSAFLQGLRLGLVRTERFVRRITHAGTGEACFCFFIKRIFLGDDFRAAIKDSGTISSF